MIDQAYDLTILGGGLSGLTLAKQLLMKRPETSILIIEKKNPSTHGAFKVGESTIEIGAYYLSEEVALKKHLVDDQLPKFGLRFFFNNGRRTLEHGIEVGLSEFFPAPGYQVDRGRLECHLTESVADMGARFLDGHVKHVDISTEDDLHTIRYEQDGSPATVRSRWVVDASGRAGILKKQLNLAEEIDHEVNAAWFHIGAEIRVDEWCEDPTWRSLVGKVPRRWLSTNHLLGRGYWVWIIPLASGATSIGIVADPRLHPLSKLNQFDFAMDWLHENEPLCAETIEPHREDLLSFKAMKRLGYSSKEVFSSQRWALTGDAGVFLDPLYSPGIDYIAMANTLICSLIDEDLGGAAIDLMAARYQGIFLTLFHDNLHTYRDQYPLFGNPQAMSLKYVWDYALYWGFPALFYFNGKLTDPAFFASVGEEIEKVRELNVRMQKFLREWNELDGDADVEGVFVDQNEIAILRQLNGDLRDRLPDTALESRFRRNVRMLQDLAAEITARVAQAQPDLSWAESKQPANERRLDDVFSALRL